MCQQLRVSRSASGVWCVDWLPPTGCPASVAREWRQRFTETVTPELLRLHPQWGCLLTPGQRVEMVSAGPGYLRTASDAVATACVRAVVELVPATVITGPAEVEAWLA
jgi:hypothetical protein